MATILFDEIVFGPIQSRRLGTSLGINLLPKDGKLCSFDCIYCECGFNKDFKPNAQLPTREEVKEALKASLIKLKGGRTPLDAITFSGNGEPTMHPYFSEIIDDTINLRDEHAPNALICVLSNAMHISKESVFNALKRVDNAILKLDSALIDTVRLIDCPNSPNYSIEKQVELFEKFEGNFILQTMFLKGRHEGKLVNNTTEEEIVAWLKLVKKLNPKEVMIYTIDRETPSSQLEKAPLELLNEIGERVKELKIKINIAG